MYVYDDGQICSLFRAKTPKVNVCEGRDKGGILARGCIKQMRDDNLMLCDWSFEWPLSIVHPGVLRGVCFHCAVTFCTAVVAKKYEAKTNIEREEEPRHIFWASMNVAEVGIQESSSADIVFAFVMF